MDWIDQELNQITKGVWMDAVLKTFHPNTLRFSAIEMAPSQAELHQYKYTVGTVVEGIEPGKEACYHGVWAYGNSREEVVEQLRRIADDIERNPIYVEKERT